MDREEVIHTDRLELHHLSVTELVSLFESPEDPWIYSGKGFTNPHRELMDNSGALARRVPQVKTNHLENKWFIRWIVLKQSREIIGSTGFHGAPDARSMVEIGLGINLNFQRQGFALEALGGMWSWASRQAGVEVLRYTVSVSNMPSISLVKRFGFHHVGQQLDEIDGPEDIFEMQVAEFKNSVHFS